jgi:hypothetical protein
MARMQRSHGGDERDRFLRRAKARHGATQCRQGAHEARLRGHGKGGWLAIRATSLDHFPVPVGGGLPKKPRRH